MTFQWHSKFTTGLLVACCLLIVCFPAFSQTTGTLHGTITDSTGAVISNATVTLRQAEAKFIRTTNSAPTNSFGYSFASVPAGTYQLEIMADGFRAVRAKSVVISVGQETLANFVLSPASSSETIEVYSADGELEPFVNKADAMGSLGEVADLDLPYSVNTIPGSVIESQHVTTLADLVKYVPSAQFIQRFGANAGWLVTRGFPSAGLFQNVLVDGMYISAPTQYPLDAYDRVEVMNGLGSGIYGAASPTGTFNFVLKRPTYNRVETFGADYDDQGNRIFRGDIGGALGPNKFFGYRLNFLEGNGTSWVRWGRVRQDFESGDFDFHLTKHTVLEANYFHAQYFQRGLPGAFNYAYTLTLPKAPDPTRPGLGQPFAGSELDNSLILVRLKHEFSSNFRVMAGVGDELSPREIQVANNTIKDNSGTYSTSLQGVGSKSTYRTAVLYLNGEEKTGQIQHKLVLGTRLLSDFNYTSTGTSTGSIKFNGSPTLYNPQVSLTTAGVIFSVPYKASVQGMESMAFGDTAIWQNWTASFTGSVNWMFARNYNSSGQLTSPAATAKYYQTAFSPTAAISYKPKHNMTAYFAYSSNVQNGDTTGTAGQNTNINPNQYLPPITTTQYEAGYKMEYRRAEITTALFRMARPYSYAETVNSPYEVQGTQVNRGLELNAKGKITRDLNVLSGLAWIDPRMRDTVTAAAEGKQYPGAPRVSVNILTDYQLSSVRALRGLAISGDYRLIGKRATNSLNTNWTDSVSTVDLGVRYSRDFEKVLATARFGVMNAANKFYWASITAGSTGTASSGGTANLGAPRTYNVSLLFTLH